MRVVSTCLSDAAIVDFSRGALAGPAREDAERHLAACEACRVLVSEVARGSFGPTSGAPALRDDDAPASLVSRTLAGKYRVDRVLGAGGMGFVVSAWHELLGERVAIKLARGELRDDAEARARLLREARAAGRLRGENVARVLDVGVLDDGAPYIVMEHLDGKNFAERLRDEGPLPIGDAVDAIIQASAALDEAHALGIVHRDLKPANLFDARRFDGTRLVKVLDFGIAKAPRGAGEPTTKAGLVLGSPLYMSPEQLKDSRRVDARTDVWAIGATLFELVAGRPAFDGRTLAEVTARIVQGPTPSLRDARRDAPAGLDRVVARCLERDPALRFASAGDVARALAPFAAQLPARRPSRRAGVAAAVVLLLLALAAAFAFLVRAR
jgi:eukaryotic-like serine/threonine-protein kinase